MSEAASLRLERTGQGKDGHPDNQGTELKWTISQEDLYPAEVICQTEAFLGLLLLPSYPSRPTSHEQASITWFGTKGEVMNTCMGL